MAIASAQPGASANDLTDERFLDVLSGNAALNGVPVEVTTLLKQLNRATLLVVSLNLLPLSRRRRVRP